MYYLKNQRNVFLLYGIIGATIDGHQFAQELQDIEADELYIKINSPGGGVIHGWSIFSALIDHPAKVNVMIDGIAGSMAGVIAQAGDVVKAKDYSKYMIHSASIGGDQEGKNEEEKRALKAINDSLATILSRRGLSKDVIKKEMESEKWYSANQARDIGLIDKVVSTKQKKAETAIEAMSFAFNQFMNYEVEDAPRTSPRTPTYNGTEKTPWSNVSKDLRWWRDIWYAKEKGGKPDDPFERIEDAPKEFLNWSVKHTTNGNANATVWGDVLKLPVVNPKTGKLNKNGIEAALSYVEQTQGINVDETRQKLRTLWNKHWGEQSKNQKSKKMNELAKFLNLNEDANENAFLNEVKKLEQRASNAEQKVDELNNTIQAKDSAINELKEERDKLKKEVEESREKTVNSKVDELVNNGYLNEEKAGNIKEKFANDYEGLMTFAEALAPVKNDIKDEMKGEGNKGDVKNGGNGEQKTDKTVTDKDGNKLPSLREMEKNNPREVERIHNENPEYYNKLFEAEYGRKPE